MLPAGYYTIDFQWQLEGTAPPDPGCTVAVWLGNSFEVAHDSVPFVPANPTDQGGHREFALGAEFDGLFEVLLDCKALDAGNTAAVSLSSLNLCTAPTV